MKNSTRGQQTGFPIPLVFTVTVVVAIYAGLSVLETMRTQLPSGDVVLCGGVCGQPPTWTIVVGGVLLIGAIFTLSHVRRRRESGNSQTGDSPYK